MNYLLLWLLCCCSFPLMCISFVDISNVWNFLTSPVDPEVLSQQAATYIDSFTQPGIGDFTVNAAVTMFEGYELYQDINEQLEALKEKLADLSPEQYSHSFCHKYRIKYGIVCDQKGECIQCIFEKKSV